MASSGSGKCCGVPGCGINNQKWYCCAEPCPMCHKFRKSFHCGNCVGNGDFGHSSAPSDKERFSEKQMKYKNAVQRSNSYKNDCEKMLSDRKCSTLKKTETSILQEKIKLLKLAILDKNKLVTEKKNLLNKLKFKIENLKSRVDRYRGRVTELKEFSKGQISVLNDKTNALITIRSSLKYIIRMRIEQLVTHIFPLNKGQLAMFQNKEPDVKNILSHTSTEASTLTYVGHQWVDTGEESSSQTKLGYRIVASTLPANGNYSAYNKWVSIVNKDDASNQTFGESNPACTISTGLTYTSQLVKKISFFLDVVLPKQPNFSDFYELNENKFSKYVIHLNANILYLCFSQNVDPKLLHPEHTMKNLLLLLDTSISDLGRVEPSDIDSSQCTAYEDKIAFQLQSLSVDSDSEDDNYSEWEAVPKMDYPADHM